MSYDIQITRQSLNALFDLKGASAAIESWAGNALPNLPDQPNSRTEKEAVELYHIGRDHWIARAPVGQEEALEARLKPNDCPADVSIVRISDTLTFFRVTGSQAGEVMAIACPLDLHDSQFGDDTVTYTDLFGLKALVMRCKDGYELAIEQSFGDMVEDYLARATA
ncbi:sarcosine oxidase subunit gamma [Rhodobacteraceae bacterium B1Z28]|uniref:Sarcosine oxidase subunit gamma n=1 Tax=Ruegeria haliotis TaxID=2747601 RepID=A0ABX2PWM5_9RHOB|nr:sarcosine oxidase subunit gamma family protein [Ruegeria haliotis]NVO58443.1 sarcosine oxidase subunit gamma [Ruegeria haliotis]